MRFTRTARPGEGDSVHAVRGVRAGRMPVAYGAQAPRAAFGWSRADPRAALVTAGIAVTTPLPAPVPTGAGETTSHLVIRFVREDVATSMLPDDVSESDQWHWLDHVARPLSASPHGQPTDTSPPS